MRKLDNTDQALLARLRDNSRATTSELARQLDLSRSTVQGRLNRLLEREVIAGFTLQLGEDYTAHLVRAQVLIELDQKLTGQAQAELKKIQKVTALYAISGAYDMIAMVEAHSTGELSRLLDEIAGLDGIARTNSSVILETKFER
jgi:DNA-binding Lrp family transcriptional regulator